ncbi:MAG: phosphatidylglycerol lysyltransferase domain-containing protein [Lachnospiraceae bacterium]|nr:phosphatidylglycerol lysyltransferase domain-containing protein [Lachnospiraceae bacterium]
MDEISFKRPQLEDRELIQGYFNGLKRYSCEWTFANFYLWSRFFGAMWAVIDGLLVFRSGYEGSYSYTFPIGEGDHRAVLERLMAEAKAAGSPFRMHSLSREDAGVLEQYFPGQFEVEWMRDYADYVYETEKLIRLSGKKYHGKKNHINQFKAQYPDWSYEPITDDNVEECFQMALRWRIENGCEADPEKNQEMCVSMNSLRLYKELGLKGGLLRAEGRIVAFTLGEPIGSSDAFVVHIEKAYADVRGAYPMINQQFLEHEVSAYRYVNREDDTGDEGLRRAKESYHPAFLVEKGYARLNGEYHE